jgi:hypothetical protein
VRDLALVLVAGIAYEAAFGRRWRLVIAAGLVLPALAVLATGTPAYYGLSGLSHAALAAALGFELRHRTGPTRWYVVALLAAGAVKIGYELAAGAPAFAMDLGPGVHQATLAHAVGGALGLALGITCLGSPRGGPEVSLRSTPRSRSASLRSADGSKVSGSASGTR